MKLQAAPFEMIGRGQKTIELRLYDEKRKKISVNDEIEFVRMDDNTATLRCRVVALHPFSCFRELYEALPLLKCGYTLQDVESASPTDMERYYSKAEQEKYGVVGIELVLL
ncbi:MAG: ASCH domain-containing protein [Clostridia bacterium]|nr:ASCH domain-containing protein [Clostridia bacterium]